MVQSGAVPLDVTMDHRKKTKAWTSIFSSANNNPSFKTGMHLQGLHHTRVLSPMCTPWPPSPCPSAAAVLTQQHTVERSGTLQQKLAPVLPSCHEGTISRVRSTMKNTAVGCLLEGQKAVLSMVSEFRANKPPNEIYGGLDLKPTD